MELVTKMFFGDEIHRQLLVFVVYHRYLQYKDKRYNHLDNVSRLAEHAINLVGCYVESALS